MKVVLIYLPHPYLIQPKAQAPLGLMYLAAVLEEAEVDVEICNFTDMYTHEAINKLPYADIYGITVTSFELPQANRFAHLIRELSPNAKIVLGGPGTTDGQSFVDWNVINSICVGDGEETILNMIADLELTGNLKKSYYSDGVDVSKIPLPARHLLKDSLGGNIFAYNNNYKEGGSTVIITSRGCPYKCSFCTAPLLSQYRGQMKHRSAIDIYQEMVECIEKYNIRQFRFSDDMFTANKKRMKEICNIISPLDIAWRISCRVKPFDEDTAKILKDSGCKEISFGVESFDDDVLQLLGKKTTVEDNIKALELCAKHEIKTRVLFMIRTPGQTRQTVTKNILMLNRVPYDIIACTTFVPIPGSDIWRNPSHYNIKILSKNLDDYNFYFYSANGENDLKNVIELIGRNMDEVNAETIEFREYLKSTNKLNQG